MPNSLDAKITITTDLKKCQEIVLGDLHPDKLVLLFSGGADSALLLHYAIYTGYSVHPLFINYGQKFFTGEYKAAKTIMEFYDRHIRLQSMVDVDISDYARLIKSPLTTGEAGSYSGVSEFYVPYRNSIFVNIACGFAETIGARKIWIGCDYSDRLNHFPDCYQEWIVGQNMVLQSLAIPEDRKITLEAPLLGMSKELVNCLLEQTGLHDKVFSGYGELK